MHASLSDLLADLAQNAIEAHASKITIALQQRKHRLSGSIRDNGKGMDADTLARARDPFFSERGKHTRKIGLGVPFLFQIAEQTEGEAHINSESGKGTCIEFRFNADHLDLPPLGVLASAILQLFTFDCDAEIEVTRSLNGHSYRVTKREMQKALGGIKRTADILLARTYLNNLEQTLNEDANNGKTNA